MKMKAAGISTMMLRKKLRYILLVKDPDIRINAKNVRLLVNLKNSQNHTELLTSDSVVAVQWLERYVWFVLLDPFG